MIYYQPINHNDLLQAYNPWIIHGYIHGYIHGKNMPSRVDEMQDFESRADETNAERHLGPANMPEVCVLLNNKPLGTHRLSRGSRLSRLSGVMDCWPDSPSTRAGGQDDGSS